MATKQQQARKGKPHGGKRPNTGRRRGSPNKASAERERKVAETGATPHEIQIIRMRYYANKFGEAVTRAQSGQPGTMVDGRVITATLTEFYLDKAGDAADRAAPYVHPRLSAIQIRDYDEWKRANDPDRAATVVDLDEDLSGLDATELTRRYRLAIGQG